MTLIIHPTAKISALADIEDSVKGSRIEIGPRVHIDSFVKIKPAGGSGDVIIGADSFINSGTVIYVGNGVKIGRGVLIAANCTLASTNHEYRNASIPIREQGFMKSKGGIVVEDDVWIGANCVILDGAHICSGAVVGAGCVVQGKVDSNTISVGPDLRVIGHRE